MFPERRIFTRIAMALLSPLGWRAIRGRRQEVVSDSPATFADGLA
jgi:hypothetical protein